METSNPKTWKELIESGKVKYLSVCTFNNKDIVDKNTSLHDYSMTGNNSPIEKSALALLKIYQLIEVSYGGIPSTKARLSVVGNDMYSIEMDALGNIGAEYCALPTNRIAFYTKEQAEEFLSYPENVQLVKDFFMI